MVPNLDAIGVAEREETQSPRFLHLETEYGTFLRPPLRNRSPWVVFISESAIAATI
jgi:hypothetical protein